MKSLRQRPAAPLQPGQPDVPLAAGLPLHFGSQQTSPAPDLPAVPGMRQVLIDGCWLNYRLRRSSRRSIGFMIDDGGLSVAAPLWLAQADVESAILHKQGWIIAKLGEWQTRSVQRHAPRLLAGEDGARLPYLGAEITLRLDAQTASPHWRAIDGADTVDLAPDATSTQLLAQTTGAAPARELVLPLPPGTDPARVRMALAKWLQDEARGLFAARLDHYAACLGLPYRKLILSSARTRWGSCTADGTIRLNWRLIYLPLHLIDYVVVHELAHLKEMNHSSRFWNVVESLYPDYLSARKALRQHPPEHLPAL